MKDTLRAEITKLTTLRMTAVVTALSLALAVFLGVVNVHAAASSTVVTIPLLAGSAAEHAWFLGALVAVLGAAGEFEHHTIRSTVLVVPRRDRVLVAKLAVAGGYAAVLAAASGAVAALVGWVTAMFDSVDLYTAPGSDWLGLLALPVAGALTAVIASGLGLLGRTSVFAVSALLLWKFVAEGILPVITRHPGLADWLPSGASHAMLVPGGAAHTLLATTALTGYAVLVAAAGGWTLLRRDIP